MSSTTLSTMLLAFAAVAAAACSAAPGDSNEADLASSQQALVRGDCAPYNGFTGALGAATIDCLGRVGTFDYAVQTSPQGFFGLTRRFDSCPNLSGNDAELKLLQIDQLLSIQAPERQYREQRAKFPKELANFPDAIACVANAFATAQKRLLEQGSTVCPTFNQRFSIGAPTEANVRRIVSLLPKPSPIPPDGRLGFPPGSFGPKFRRPKEYPIYTVSFDQQPPATQPCGRAEACAKACSSVFAGFFVAQFGRLIVGDPDWWTDPTNHGFGGSSPYYKVNGYYHPMAAAGDGPGALYGNIARAPASPLFPPQFSEQCTYWTPDGDLLGQLVVDNPSAPLRNALSRCQP